MRIFLAKGCYKRAMAVEVNIKETAAVVVLQYLYDRHTKTNSGYKRRAIEAVWSIDY